MSLVCEGVTSHMTPDVVLGETSAHDAAGWAAFTAITAVALLFWLAMALIPMKWREPGLVALVVLAGACVALPLTMRVDLVQGVLAGEDFDPCEVHIATPSGAMVLVYTDGAFEAMDAGGEQFSLERVREIEALASGDRARTLVERVLEFRRGKAQDDLLAVEVAWGAAGTAVRRASGTTRLTKMLTGGSPR